MLPSQELATREQQSQLALVASAIDGALGVLSEDLSVDVPGLKGDLRLVWAEAGNALEVPVNQRNRQEAVLAKFRQVVPAVQKSIKAGLVTSAEDSSDLSSVLMSYSQHPGMALRYLSATSNSLVDRPLAPRELINAILIHQDFLDEQFEGESNISMAVIIRAADHAGVSLFNLPQEEDLSVIEGTMKPFNFIREVSRSTTDGIPYTTFHEIEATAIGSDAIGFAAASRDDQGIDPDLEQYFRLME